MKNKEKMILGIIVAAIIIGVAGGYIFSQPFDNSTLNISNQSTDQGTGSQNSGTQGTGTQNKVNSNKNSTNTGGTNPGTTGSQYKTCPTCGGTGSITKTVSKQVACPKTISLPVYDPITHKIVGYRDADCPICGGTGSKTVTEEVKEKCSTCSGSGKVKA